MKNLKIGIICSTAGSVFNSAINILRNSNFNIEFSVVTDRECEVERVCKINKIPVSRFYYADKQEFSRAAANWLYDEQGVELTCLFFTRLVGSELFTKGPCINIHPSLLPTFPGFRAVEKAFKYGVKIFGATAHFVDETIDGGKIIAQISSPIPVFSSLDKLERISFSHKLYLFLLIIEMARNGHIITNQNNSQEFIYTANANPSLEDENLIYNYFNFLKLEGINW